jgi:glutaredoxin-related protein
MRTLSEEKIAPPARAKIQNFHTSIVEEVKKAIATHKIVVVGMKQNPVVKSARKFLDEEGLEFHYLEYGSYMSMWKERLAIKLWSGWPTFPQVFIDGTLIGGNAELVKHLAKKQ